MGSCWTFLDYVSDGGKGRNKIREWLDGLSEDVAAVIDYRLRTMENAETWPPKWFKKLKGLENVWELRICHNKVQYRPLYTCAGNKSFLLLVGTIEKSSKIPQGDLIAAQQRLADWKRDSKHAKPHIFDSDKNLEIISEQKIQT